MSEVVGHHTLENEYNVSLVKENNLHEASKIKMAMSKA